MEASNGSKQINFLPFTIPTPESEPVNIPPLRQLKTLWSMLLACLSIAGMAHESGHSSGQQTNSCPFIAVTNLTPFLDPLHRIGKMVPSRTNVSFRLPEDPNQHFPPLPEYDVRMSSFHHRFHTNLPLVEVWGYNGSSPGLTFEVNVGSPILVNWINDLPDTYPPWLPANESLHGVHDQTVRNVVHLHGAASLPRYDGYPTNTFVKGETRTYFYGNIDFNGDGETLWYHDHAISRTANNVYAGLAGFYLVRHPERDALLNLPSGDFEIPMVFQDKDIQTNCAPPSLMLGAVPWHSLAVVNGKVNPYLDVEPRKYRFRILNGSGFRTFGPSLVVTDTAGVPVKAVTNAPAFTIIGNDDGFLQNPVSIPNPIPANSNLSGGRGNTNTPGFMLMPGERIDLVIDFSAFNNQVITMKNLVNNADPTNIIVAPPQRYMTNIMQFRVSLPLSSADTSTIPDVLVTNWVTTATMSSNSTVNRYITLDLKSESPFPGPPFNTTNGVGPFALLNMKQFEAPIDTFPAAGNTETWWIINLSGEAHPIHVHLLDFRVISRIRFAGWNTNSNTRFPPTMVTNYIMDRIAGKLQPLTNYLDVANSTFPVGSFEAGPKDVVRAAPYAATLIVMQWPTNSMFYSSPSAWDLDPATTGRYIYHCHILDHEDNDMMQPLKLLPPGDFHVQLVPDAKINPTGNNRFKFRIDSEKSAIYRVEYSTSATGGSWIPLPIGDLLGTGDPIDIVPPTSTDPVQLYRTRKTSP